jgi:hypothetical protein
MNKTDFERRDLKSHYTKIPNDVLSEKKISYKATGILACLLRHKAGFVLSLEFLVSQKNEGKDSVRSGLKELEDHGYLKITKIRQKSGKIAGYHWMVSDQPIYKKIGEPYPDDPIQVKPTQENQPLINTTKQTELFLTTTTTDALQIDLNSIDGEHTSRIYFLAQKIRIDKDFVETQFQGLPKEAQIDILCETLAIKIKGGLRNAPENLLATLVRKSKQNEFFLIRGRNIKNDLIQLKHKYPDEKIPADQNKFPSTSRRAYLSAKEGIFQALKPSKKEELHT